jgi:hypothetical protein
VLEVASSKSSEESSRSDEPAPGGRRDGSAQAMSSEVADGGSDSAVLGEWLASPAIRAWAQIKPSLIDLDLRPYVFVAKDRKNFFGAASALGHLHALVEQLLGSKMAVATLEAEVKQLAPREAAQAFEGVRSRVVATGDFATEPPGAAGLAVLVRTHPELQNSLLTFLDGLSRERLGPWVTAGWEGAIKDPDMNARFDRLLETWANLPKSSMLKSAAAATLRTRKSTR